MGYNGIDVDSGAAGRRIVGTMPVTSQVTYAKGGSNMSTSKVLSPTSRVRFGLARADVTPPANIYHRMWGAARHDRASGVHRPIMAEVMVFGPTECAGVRMVRAQLDLVGLVIGQHDRIVTALSQAAATSPENVVVTYSHSHSSGWFHPSRLELPGGELILGYIDELVAKMSDAGRRAADAMQEAIITYGAGRCNMAANRDYWD